MLEENPSICLLQKFCERRNRSRKCNPLPPPSKKCDWGKHRPFCRHSRHSRGCCLLLPVIGRLSYCRKRQEFPIRTIILLQNNANFHIDNVISCRICILELWNNLQIVLSYPPVFNTYLGLWKKHLGVNDSATILLLEPSCAIGWRHTSLFFLWWRHQKISNPFSEMCFEIRRLYRKVMCKFLLCTLYQ